MGSYSMVYETLATILLVAKTYGLFNKWLKNMGKKPSSDLKQAPTARQPHKYCWGGVKRAFCLCKGFWMSHRVKATSSFPSHCLSGLPSHPEGDQSTASEGLGGQIINLIICEFQHPWGSETGSPMRTGTPPVYTLELMPVNYVYNYQMKV